MQPVWHVEVDFKVKPLDFELVFNVYNVHVAGETLHQQGVQTWDVN